MRLILQRTAFVFWYGAIAQLGERVLCKHEVVGSIPSGSTTLRLRLRVARSRSRKRNVPGEARQSEDGLTADQQTSSAKTSLRMRCPSQDARAGFLTS